MYGCANWRIMKYDELKLKVFGRSFKKDIRINTKPGIGNVRIDEKHGDRRLIQKIEYTTL